MGTKITKKEIKKLSPFRTPYSNQSFTKERNNGVAPDFIDKDYVPLSEIIDRFNRGQRLSGVNYEVNDNFLPGNAGKEFDDPDSLYPIRCDDIVDVKNAEVDVKARKQALEAKFNQAVIEKQKENEILSSEQVTP